MPDEPHNEDRDEEPGSGDGQKPIGRRSSIQFQFFPAAPVAAQGTAWLIQVALPYALTFLGTSGFLSTIGIGTYSYVVSRGGTERFPSSKYEASEKLLSQKCLTESFDLLLRPSVFSISPWRGEGKANVLVREFSPHGRTPIADLPAGYFFRSTWKSIENGGVFEVGVATAAFAGESVELAGLGDVDSYRIRFILDHFVSSIGGVGVLCTAHGGIPRPFPKGVRLVAAQAAIKGVLKSQGYLLTADSFGQDNQFSTHWREVLWNRKGDSRHKLRYLGMLVEVYGRSHMFSWVQRKNPVASVQDSGGEIDEIILPQDEEFRSLRDQFFSKVMGKLGGNRE